MFIGNQDLDFVIESKIGKTNDKDYQCFDCGYVTQGKRNMKVHVEGKHITDHPGIVCQYCNKRVSTREALRNHLSRSRCSAFHWFLFTELDAAINSNMSRKEDGNWLCNVCGFKSNRKSNCQSHVESKHIVSAGFHCNICGIICSNRKSLRNHQDRRHRVWHFDSLTF